MKNKLLKMLSHRLNDIKLKNKLLIFYGTLICFSILMTGLFTYYYIQQYIRDQASETLCQTLAQIETNIESRINTYDEMASKMIINEQLRFALFRTYQSPDEYSLEYLNTILPVFQFKENDENILDISIYKANSSLPEDGYNLLSLEILQNVWWFRQYFGDLSNYTTNNYMQLSKMKIWVINDQTIKPAHDITSRGSNGKRLTLVKPIIFNFDKLVGVLVVELKYAALFEDSLSQFSPERNRIFIQDGTGKEIYSNILHTEDTSRKLSEISAKWEGQKSGRDFVTSDGGSILLLYQQGRYSDWKYYMEVPLSYFMENVVNLRNVIVVIAFLSILLSFFIGLLIAGMLSRRTALLAEKMSQIEDLTLDVAVPLEGMDEIGHLAASFNRMIMKLKELVASLKASQQTIRETEIRALQAQINPHFLYNSLAAISWMATGKKNEGEKIAAMVENLSVFYRLSLNKGKEYLTFEDEVNQVRAYANLQKIRLEDKVNVYFDIEDNVLHFFTLKLIIQPFVENAILHGTGYKGNLPTNIVVRGRETEGRVHLEVVDDGIGMKMPDTGEYPISKGYGIRNVHEKIQLQYGPDYGVKIYSRRGIGTAVSLDIPAVRENPNRI